LRDKKVPLSHSRVNPSTCLNGQKFKDFQSCLPILPAYLPLKFPNGQFPLKIPGPISQAKLKPMGKKYCPLKKNQMVELRFYLKIAFG
jgi:hypothetical protein